MKKVAVIQSNYIPWKGYFDIIHDVDLFIFYDDVQYTKNDWRNRNRVKSNQGTQWITVPIGSHNSQLINEVEISNKLWAKKHFNTLKMNYSKTPYFHRYLAFLEHVYLEREWCYLSELNQYLIKIISKEFLGIETLFADSREYSASGVSLDRLIDLLKQVQADTYISGPAANSYIKSESFFEAGIELVYKDYSGYPEYPQLNPPFDHYVSIMDLLFHTGPDAAYFIWGWRPS
ncbi:WbqC family protein [Cohnella boryungensis]|uniref:WbqC family protein n=1 Tax=Cohnella boryungensis TaxID=768479 RepID=A0ABV8S912_9BACL